MCRYMTLMIQLSECVTRFTMNVSHLVFLFFSFFCTVTLGPKCYLSVVSIHNKTVVLQKFVLKKVIKKQREVNKYLFVLCRTLFRAWPWINIVTQFFF